MSGEQKPTGRVRDGVVRRGNTWSYVVRITDSSGVNKPRWVGGFPTEEAAKAARDEARVIARRGAYVNRNGVTVAAYLRDWLELHSLEVKPKTLAGYRFNVETYVIPRIGRQRLQNIRPMHLSALYRELLDKGGKDGGPLSVRSVEYVHAVLRKAFADAVRNDQLIPSNPANRAKRPRNVGEQHAWEEWTAGDLRVFLGAAGAHRLSALFRLAAYSGARRGELLALRWADLDLGAEAPAVRIRRNVVQVAGVAVEGTPKGGRSRTVSLDTETVAVLREHRAVQTRDREIAGDSWVPGEWVFRRQIGAPLHPDTPTRLMAGIIRAHNEGVEAGDSEHPLPAFRFHDLRHLHAPLLLRAGVPAHVVAARLGHADPAITLRVYAHVLGDQAAHAADVFAAEALR